ncbi:MAG TPA: DNA replication/repair protein RecF [Clostridiaceae bacterium]|nr:DNA replication/repair protein RecF [Clostridiaceae bacterium]
MRLSSIELSNFRNYDRLRLDIPDGTHVFHGANAQGKTNLLEAIYLCTCARSHRTGRDEELIRHGSDYYRVNVQFVTDRGLHESVALEYRIASARGGSPSRTVYYNDLEVSRLSDMMGLFHAIIFAPEDLQIVKGGPSERRRFLDVLISRTDRAYFRSLQDFWRVIGQRNRLLKNLRANGTPNERDMNNRSYGGRTAFDEEDCEVPDDGIVFPNPRAQLDIWDEQLASIVSFILKKRLDVTERLSEYASLSLRHLTSSQELLDIQYRGFGGIDHDMSRETIERLYLERLRRAQDDDIMRGSTSTGPHRDDLLFALNGVEARLFSSQGQQRSIVLSLKIAELMLLTKLTGETPILLLDDVMSELDQSRRARLMEVISGHQVFLTCTDTAQIFPPTSSNASGEKSDERDRRDERQKRDEWAGNVYYYEVVEGTVKPEGQIPKEE